MKRLLLFIALSSPAFGQCTSHLTTSTFAAAYSAASGGAVLCLAAGNYGSFSGSVKSSTVTIQSDASAGGTQANVIFSGVNFASASNITMNNMTIGGGTVSSTSTAATHIHLTNIKFTGALCINNPTNVNQDTLVDSSSFGPNWQGGQSCTEGRLGVNGNNINHTVTNGVVISNTLFDGPTSGSNGADGIQINGGAFGTVIGPGNTFSNITETFCGATHCDAIQFFGAVNTTVNGNFFINDSDAIMTPDCNGTPMFVTNNVFVQDPTSATSEVLVGGGNGDVFNHNTFGSGHSNLRIGNPNGCGLSANETITNSVLMGGTAFTEGQTTGTFTQDYNLIPGGGTGSHTVNGSPTFTGGSSPTTLAGFVLTSGSLGHNVSSTGTDMGFNTAGTTWYIRSDGGTRTQCTGTTDAAYPGSGSNQPCGFNDFRWLYDNQTFGNHAWVISGGDTVHIESCVPGSDGPGCQVGFSQGASSSDPWCSGGSGAIGCTPPTAPSGTPSNPTTFRGANFAACTSNSAKTILHGSYDMSQMFDVRGAHDISIQCLEITGYSSCRTTGDAPVTGDPAAAHICANNYPFDDNMQTGVVTDASSSNILLQDVYIHRVTNRGIQGPIGGLVDLNRVHIGWTGQTGWDLDDGSGTHSVNGTMSIRNSLIEWAGAMEQFPDTLTVPTILQFDDSHGTVADCIGTPDTPLTVVITNSTFRYCSQDGPDIGHIDGNSGGVANVTVTSSYFYGNMGQQLKWGGVTNATLTTSELVGNCHRLATQVGDETDPKTHLSDFCRAAGDTLSFNNLKGGNSLIQGNTFVGYNNEYMLWGCWDNDGSGHCTAPVPTLTLRDNIFLGFSNPAWNGGVPPNLISDNGDQAPTQTTEDHNTFFNLKGGNCGSGGTGDICADPLLIGGSTFTSEPMFDAYNFNLTSSSPPKFAGIALSGVTTDFAGNVYHAPPSQGPLELTGASPTLVSIAVTPNPGAVTTTLAMTCTATYSDSSTGACVSPVWTDTGVHSSVNSSTGVVTGVSTGSDTVTATIGSISGNATVNVTITPPTVATPTASPMAGTYTSTQSVTLSDATSGAAICFTTDGTIPTAPTPGTCSGGTTQTYSTALSVATTTTIKALGTKAGSTNSSVFSGLYTITPPAPPTSTFSGTVKLSGSVVIQ